MKKKKIGCSLFEVKGNNADSFVVPASSFSLEEIGIDEEIGCSLFEVKGNTADSVVVVPASSFSIEEIVIDEAIGCSLFEVKGNTVDFDRYYGGLTTTFNYGGLTTTIKNMICRCRRT